MFVQTKDHALFQWEITNVFELQKASIAKLLELHGFKHMPREMKWLFVCVFIAIDLNETTREERFE